MVGQYVNLWYENVVPCLGWEELETSPSPQDPCLLWEESREWYLSLLLTAAKLKSSDLRRGDRYCQTGLPQYSTYLFFQYVVCSSLRFCAEWFLCMARWCLRRLMREMIQPRTLVSGNILQGVYLGEAESRACLIIYFKGEVCVTTKLDMHPVPYCTEITIFLIVSFHSIFICLMINSVLYQGKTRVCLTDTLFFWSRNFFSNAIVM